jgi:hypothetical protein
MQAAEEAMLEAARDSLMIERAGAAGLDDFGGGAWREHLRALLRAYDEESRLTEAG